MLTDCCPRCLPRLRPRRGKGSSLHGETSLARATTDMWCARAETKFLVPLFWSVRCGPLAKFFADRTPGYIHPEIAEPMSVAAKAGMAWLDGQLAADGRPFLCGDRFTSARASSNHMLCRTRTRGHSWR